MAIRLLMKGLSKEGKFMIIFSGGGKLVWYPTKEELLYLLEQFEQKGINVKSST